MGRAWILAAISIERVDEVIAEFGINFQQAGRCWLAGKFK
jgi:hypothetical protein